MSDRRWFVQSLLDAMQIVKMSTVVRCIDSKSKREGNVSCGTTSGEKVQRLHEVIFKIVEVLSEVFVTGHLLRLMNLII